MSSIETEPSPTTQTWTTPGAYPSTPAESESATIISSQLSLSQAVHKRRKEYTRSYKTRVKVGTWNVASLGGTERDIGGWFVDGKGVSESLSGLALNDEDMAIEESQGRHEKENLEEVGLQEARRTKKKSTLPKNDHGSLPGGETIGLYVLGLQEIVNVTSPTEALGLHSDHEIKKWKRAVAKSLPEGYLRVAEQQLVGLYLVIYASPIIAPTVSSVSTTSVGTGLLGVMGNKGGVTARIVLGETTRLVFINCHLTAGVEKGSLERRNWDASQILSKTKFDPVYDGGGVMEEFGEGIGDEDFAFWFGDLNYRLDSIPAEDVRRLLMVHTQKEYENGQGSTEKFEVDNARPASPVVIQEGENAQGSSEDEGSSSRANVTSVSENSVHSSNTFPSSEDDPSNDPASLQTTISSLLLHDQLHSQMRTRKAFQEGWQEGPINFLPTYKYDVGSVALFDSSEKKRGPSWCDRILYRTRNDMLEYDKMVKEEGEVKRRDEEMKARGVDKAAADDEEVLFDYDPGTDGAAEEYDETSGATVDPEIVITKSGFEDKLHLDYYTSHQRVLSSDHKPLDAVFSLTYDAIDPELKARVHQDVARELDRAENEGRPGVTIVVDHQHDRDGNLHPDSHSPDFDGVNFGDVKYDHRKTRNITIANTGRVPATFGFVDRSIDQGKSGGAAPPWLQIQFDRASDNNNSNPGALQVHTLDPGDASNVELTTHVTDLDQVRRLNDGLENLEDVLVLRIHNGRDYFLPVRGTWLQSAFGRAIDKLIRIPEGGVRKMQHQRPNGSSHSNDEGVKWSAPKEVFRLTEAIEELAGRVVAEWGMKGELGNPPWNDIGWPFALSKGLGGPERERLKECVREALDTDQRFTELFPPETESLQKLEVIAETLPAFLKSLKDGIVTEASWTEIETSINERERLKTIPTGEETRSRILEILSGSPPHSISFTFLTFMLSRVAEEIAPIRPSTTTPNPPLPTQENPDENSRTKPWVDESARKRRQQIDTAFASIFAEAMIRIPAGVAKRKVSEARRNGVLESFLRARWDES